MRVFALSDLHVDYRSNAEWVAAVSSADYLDDILILAGDVSDKKDLLEWCLTTLARRFMQVLFVPGNHELWVIRERVPKTSFDKFLEVQEVVEASGASCKPYQVDGLQILPLFGWYDYSFGSPNEELKALWMDFHACRWPAGVHPAQVTAHFAALNHQAVVDSGSDIVITYSHFLPRIDLMPAVAAPQHAMLYPVLGSATLERQLRRLRSRMHVYGHSHVNRWKDIDGVTYVNNAFGNPSEGHIAAKRLLCIHEC